MKYSGIDLHSNNCVVVVADESDKVLVEKRVPNRLDDVLALLLPFIAELAGVVVESTFNWYWLVDGLEAAGFNVHLANTTAIRKYDGLKHGDDQSDARYLAHLLRLGILPTGSILPREHRALRDLARKRMQLVHDRTAHVLAVENIFARQFGRRISGNDAKRLTPMMIDQLKLLSDVQLALKSNAVVIDVLNRQIEAIEDRLNEQLRGRADFEGVMSIPGIGRTLATVILLETGPIARFAEVGNFASYARCVGSEWISNGKKKGCGNTKNGNKYLGWAFVEAANFAMRYCPQAKRFYDKKKAKAKSVVAVKALAHKLARACYYIMRDGTTFDVDRCFA